MVCVCVHVCLSVCVCMCVLGEWGGAVGWPAYLWVRLNYPDLERGIAPRSDIKNCF